MDAENNFHLTAGAGSAFAGLRQIKNFRAIPKLLVLQLRSSQPNLYPLLLKAGSTLYLGIISLKTPIYE